MHTDTVLSYLKHRVSSELGYWPGDFQLDAGFCRRLHEEANDYLPDAFTRRGVPMYRHEILRRIYSAARQQQ